MLATMATWCECTDPEFVTEAAGAVGPHKAPDESTVVSCVDEKPPTQAPGRARSYTRASNRPTMIGCSDSCKRNSISTVCAGPEVATDKVTVAHKNHHHRVEFLGFMTKLVAAFPSETATHIALDNLGMSASTNNGCHATGALCMGSSVATPGSSPRLTKMRDRY
jgi:hypothetical protein